MTKIPRSVLALFLGALSLPAAAVITVQSGGITLDSFDTSTAGSAADPWLIAETMTSTGFLQLTDDEGGGSVGPGNPTGSGHSTGRWFRKEIVNNTGIAWTSFELELFETLGTPSGQGDGLSFADGSGIASTFTSDQFATYTRLDVTRDYLNFSGGVVNPGEAVIFNFAITDNSPTTPIYLNQIPNRVDRPVIPEPGSMVLLGSGLIAGLLLLRRKANC